MIQLRLRRGDTGDWGYGFTDITELKIDARSCSGVGFANQEARMAEVEVELLPVLENLILSGSVLDCGYLNIRADIERDGEAIFSGFIKRDVEIKRESANVRTMRIQIYDVLWVMLDFAEGKQAQFMGHDRIYPIYGLRYKLVEVLSEMPADIRRHIVIVDNYAPLLWAPYYAPGAALFSAANTNLGLQPEYPNILRRGIVIYEQDGELYLEYCLHDVFTFLAGFPGYINATYFQHMVWQKYKLVDQEYGNPRLDLQADSGSQFISHDAVLGDDDPDTIANWIALLPSILDNYEIHEENGITHIIYEGVKYLIEGMNFYLSYLPSEAVVVGNGNESDGETEYAVDMTTFFGDMAKLLCAWLDADGMVLRIRNRFVLPAESGYSIGEDEILNFRRLRGEGSNISIDVGYLVNAELIRDGVLQYYEQMLKENMPYSYELEVILGEHRYAVGDVIDYSGNLIMITEIDEDPLYGRDARLRGVGGEL